MLLSWSSLSQRLIYPNRFCFFWVCWFSQCNCWYFQCIVAITHDFCCSWWRLVTMWFLIDICSLEFYTPVSGQAQRACYNTAIHAGGLNQWWQALQCSDGLIHIISYTERHRYRTLHWLPNHELHGHWLSPLLFDCDFCIVHVLLDLENEKLHFLSTNLLTVVDEIDAFNLLRACPFSFFFSVLTCNKHARV